MGDGNGSELSPGNATFRFLLELAALTGWGIVGWRLTDGGIRWIFVVVFPLAAATVWGVFRAPDDHSANGESPIPIPGPVRLFIELGMLLGAAVLIGLVWRPWAGGVLGAAVAVHYLATFGRVRWLLEKRRPA